jgi:hypothetical protein
MASLSRAAAGGSPVSPVTMAVLTSPSAASSSRPAAARSAPVADATIRRARSRSLALAARRSTMRLPKVRPVRTITSVDNALTMTFCTVPAFSRVEPASSSGPVGISTGRSTTEARGVPSSHTTATVSAPAAAAASAAARVNGVRPLADSAISASTGRSDSALTATRPSSGSSSASSRGPVAACDPPATTAMTRPGTRPKVGPHSAASSRPSRPGVPAPAYTIRPPAANRSARASTTGTSCPSRCCRARRAASSPPINNPSSSSVGRRSRSASSASHLSVAAAEPGLPIVLLPSLPFPAPNAEFALPGIDIGRPGYPPGRVLHALHRVPTGNRGPYRMRDSVLSGRRAWLREGFVLRHSQYPCHLIRLPGSARIKVDRQRAP